MARLRVGRAAVLRYRVHVQGLDHQPDPTLPVTAPDVLDLGVQDSGTGGALWALANRGVVVSEGRWPRDELALVWGARGAPHAYRRRDVEAAGAALRPYSPADAARRIGTAAAPLAAAGIPADRGLATLARHLRAIVTEPLEKGTVSSRLTAAVGEPYVQPCVPCAATHVPDLAFRLAALHAGLELEPGTSPPVLRRIPGRPDDDDGTPTGGPTDRSRLDPVRAYLHHLGPARPADVAGHLGAPTGDVAARWPTDAVEVDVHGERRWTLADDADALRAADATTGGAGTVRLLGPFDPLLQGRDRAALVPDAEHRRALWPALGRPGAVLADGELVGTWRPRASGRSLRVLVDRWADRDPALDAALARQAERLAAFRGADLAGLAFLDRADGGG